MMTKIELIKNYTIDELASMVLRKDEEIRQIDYALKKYLGIKHTDVDTQDEFEKLLQKQMNKSELPIEPIDVASMLINAMYTRKKGDAIHKAFGNNSETITENIYSVNDLKEIAEHLLAAKEVADEAMRSIEINGITLREFCDKLNSLEDNECHLSSCRYNRNCICQNEKKRKECIDVSMLVLCLEENK